MLRGFCALLVFPRYLGGSLPLSHGSSPEHPYFRKTNNHENKKLSPNKRCSELRLILVPKTAWNIDVGEGPAMPRYQKKTAEISKTPGPTGRRIGTRRLVGVPGLSCSPTRPTDGRHPRTDAAVLFHSSRQQGHGRRRWP